MPSVLADAQFTLANIERKTILRPFPGFEAVYQGQDGSIPIVFPGTLDADAGKAGISPYLLAGVPAPLGAKALLWLPTVAEAITIDDVSIPIDYGYVIHWRMRNVADYNRSFDQHREPQPFHLSDQGDAAEDTELFPTSPQRKLIPSATETIIFEQVEPTSIFGAATAGPGVGNLRTQGIAVPSDNIEASASLGLPLLPPNAAPPFANAYPPGSGSTVPLGAFEQGVADPGAMPLAPYSIFRPYFTTVKGDEMLIACVRRPPSSGSVLSWDFQLVDAQFSNIYGTNVKGPTHAPFKNLGIYVFFGSNPS